jgi:hypothetical protein
VKNAKRIRKQGIFFIALDFPQETNIFACDLKIQGYGNHGDYVFGWKGNALQTAMDTNCNINCPQLKTQSIQQGNQCSVKATVNEPIDGCEFYFYSLFFFFFFFFFLILPLFHMCEEKKGWCLC